MCLFFMQKVSKNNSSRIVWYAETIIVQMNQSSKKLVCFFEHLLHCYRQVIYQIAHKNANNTMFHIFKSKKEYSIQKPPTCTTPINREDMD